MDFFYGRSLQAMRPENVRRAQIEAEISEVRRLWSSGERAMAVAGAEDLYRKFPGKHAVAQLLAYYLYTTRNLDRALAVAHDCFERFPNPQVLLLLCRILTRAGRDAEILKLTSGCSSNPRLLPYALLCHGGALLKISGEFDSAVEFFHRAAEAGDLENDQAPARAALRLDEFDLLATGSLAANSLRFLSVPPPEGIETVVMAAADERYFRALYELYMSTFFTHHPGANHVLHFHLYDPSEFLLEEVADLARARQGRLQFSWEMTDRTNRSYYYVGRFVQMPLLMLRYNAPIVATDIDCGFRAGIDPILEAVRDADLGMVEVERHIVPWRNLLANLVVFNCTETARMYAMAIRNFLLRLPNDINYWYVDQLALVQCDYLARSAHAGKVVRVSQEWRQVVRQGTGKTGMPEAKAGRVANALARSSRQLR
jgi:tetratricopeptide (TPR) repeat protein